MTKKLQVVANPAPLLIPEKQAAGMIGQSREKRRRQRYQDAARMAAGQKPLGPRWIKDGVLILYHVDELERHAERLQETGCN